MKRDQTGQLSKSSKLLESFGCGRFKGTLSNIRIWNTVRSQTQIAAYQDKSLLATEPGLLAYYQFLEKGAQNLKSTTDDVNNAGYLGSAENLDDPNDPDWVNITNCDNVARKGVAVEEEFVSKTQVLLYPKNLNRKYF